jgi:hypothetical protein
VNLHSREGAGIQANEVSVGAFAEHRNPGLQRSGIIGQTVP